MAMLQQDAAWPQDDETAWCSAFVNYCCRLLGVERSGDSAAVFMGVEGVEVTLKSQALRARSWLMVGTEVTPTDARPGFDVVILKRGSGDQPGAAVIEASGHVGFYHSHTEDKVFILGGNQGNTVSVQGYPRDRILGVRRLGMAS
jgi:uncharacterized protein (TIGR02594 family)